MAFQQHQTATTPGTRAVANGKYAAWPTAAWGPVFLQGTAGKTSGKWRAADLPQWDAEQRGGRKLGRLNRRGAEAQQEPDRGGQLALFINTNKESALKFANEQFLFPVLNEVLTDPSFAQQGVEFYGGQKVNEKFAADLRDGQPGLRLAAVHGLRVHELQRDARQGVR